MTTKVRKGIVNKDFYIDDYLEVHIPKGTPLIIETPLMTIHDDEGQPFISGKYYAVRTPGKHSNFTFQIDSSLLDLE